ncbi:hypothetical protein [Nocardia altamirensis]|uniref:hypothetical protein n=1 Tax=Nocardia altamirensis TaxID=472158 RepID=UPI000840075D|nr:hypothetical protein [Nocardia altamirensis]
MSSDVTAIRDAIHDYKAGHNPKLDSFFYNGGTVVALAASIVATTLPWSGDLQWIPRALTAVAAIIIGSERALGFGERWRFHLGRYGAARSLEIRLARAGVLEPADEAKEISAIVHELGELLRNDRVPGGQLDIPRREG